MRNLLGGLALVAGVGGLGIWGANDHAVKMETAIGDGAAKVAEGAIHGVDTVVTGRDIIVSGYADTEAERAALLAALNDVPGRRVVRDALKVLPVSDPFFFEAEKTEDMVVLTGHVPTAVAKATLAPLGEGGAALALASGAPDAWLGAAATSVGALEPLTSGAVTMRGADIMFSGTAATPLQEAAARAELATLPGGFVTDVVIDVIDNGQPDFDMAYDADAGAQLTGKLPKGVDHPSVGRALGVSRVGGTAFTSYGEDFGVLEDLTALQGWLAEFDSLLFSRREGVSTVQGLVLPGVDSELVQAGLSESLPGVEIAISTSLRAVVEGTTRTNARTGLTETFTAGYWLPQIRFQPSLGACEAQANGVLENAKINFVTGSARLGARSVRVVNALASVLRTCVHAGGLTLELGGHTDSTGSAEANMALSAQRAQAVRDALVARGVDLAAITATGYGATLPIADNETEAGRAANRRTTITWSK